jgi:hypothetical protein
VRSNAIVALWSITKTQTIPLDARVKELRDLPYTLSYIIRKRMQYDNMMEIPKDKRPSQQRFEELIFNSTSDELEDYLDTLLDTKSSGGLSIAITDIEG